jgi:uncharacterized GH25 family protein
MNTKHALMATAVLVATALPCFAHDTWLMPRSPRATEDKPAIVDLTSGTAFPKIESAIKSDRVVSGGWRTSSANGRADRFEDGDASLVAQYAPSGEGTAVLFVTLKPKEIELEADEVAHYFDEIGASEALRRHWEEAGEDATFRETYTKHAKTFVRVGDGDGADATCLRPVGFAVELIPQSDPTALSVGDELVVKAVRGGDDELESFAVGFVCGATGEAELVRTNESGKVAFTISSPGWWMVRATELRHQADGTFKSDFVTMTFFVDGD